MKENWEAINKQAQINAGKSVVELVLLDNPELHERLHKEWLDRGAIGVIMPNYISKDEILKKYGRNR